MLPVGDADGFCIPRSQSGPAWETLRSIFSAQALASITVCTAIVVSSSPRVMEPLRRPEPATARGAAARWTCVGLTRPPPDVVGSTARGGHGHGAPPDV